MTYAQMNRKWKKLIEKDAEDYTEADHQFCRDLDFWTGEFEDHEYLLTKQVQRGRIGYMTPKQIVTEAQRYASYILTVALESRKRTERKKGYSNA